MRGAGGVQVKVQDLCFSPDDQFLASIGGQDDNSMVLWDVESGAAICGSPTSSEGVNCVTFLNNDAFTLVTAGTHNMDVWAFDPNHRKVRPSSCNLGKLRRHVETLVIDSAVRVSVDPCPPVRRRATGSPPGRCARVCLDAPKDLIFIVPCGHQCVCSRCAEQLRWRRGLTLGAGRVCVLRHQHR